MQRAPLDGFHTSHDSLSWNSLPASTRGGRNLEDARLAMEGLTQGGETERETEGVGRRHSSYSRVKYISVGGGGREAPYDILPPEAPDFASGSGPAGYCPCWR